MTGVYLQGGGAKGAFQAGAICALHDLGVKFDVVTGTSIGAINGYFIYTGQYKELKNLWLDVDTSELSYVREEDNIIENIRMIERLRLLEDQSNELKAYYVNYVEVKDCQLIQGYDDLTKLSKAESLKRIRYSALLPKPRGLKLNRETLEAFDSKYLFERFNEELIHGEYNDMSLDGGILNNHFLEPFQDEHVDRLILLPFQPDYKVPEYILEKYDKDQLVIIDPEEKFLPMDTLRFEPEFCNHQFNVGYQRATDIWNSK